MIKGYINSVVSKHFYGCALGEHIPEDETFYDVFNDKLENMTQTGNLPIFTGFYTEYLDKAEIEINNVLDDRFVIKNYLNQN